MNPQRNSRARKNAPTGNAQRYQTPCTKVARKIETVEISHIHHFGGEEPKLCHMKRMVMSAEMLNRNGRPNINRVSTCSKTEANTSVASHASGRFNHGNAEYARRRNS